MTEYTPNSHKYREEQKEAAKEKKDALAVEKRAVPVVAGTAGVKKKSELSKFAKTFIAEDAGSVGSYIMKDLVIPTIRNTLFTVVKEAASMIFLGKNGVESNKRSTISSNVSYRKFYDEPSGRPAARAVDRFDFDEIEFPTKGDAEIVLDEMGNMLDRYGYVRVGDMYDFAGITAPYTSYRYGWSNLRMADIRRTMDGKYIIKMPSAMPIEQ